MKILIVSPISLPILNTLTGIIDSSEKVFRVSYHNHPWIYNLAKGLTTISDTEVHILSVSNVISKEYHFIIENIHYHLLPSENKYINAGTFFMLEGRKIKKQIQKIKPDIIHAQDRSYLAYASLHTCFPIVITNHGQIEEHYKALGKKNFKYYIFLYYLKIVNRNMKYCIGVSPNCTNNCKKFLSEDRIFLIPNAINPIFFEERKLEDQNTILFTGSITPLKQVKELVLAISKVENCKLKLIYQSYTPAYFEEIKQLIKTLKIENRVFFLGQKNQVELADEIATCTALCLPSTYESFGMVLAEAMAVGKPVIASKIEGPSFIVTHNYNGLLFESGNVAELAQCISLLINDKAFVEKLAKQAKQDASLRFSPESVAKKTFAVYKKILSL